MSINKIPWSLEVLEKLKEKHGKNQFVRTIPSLMAEPSSLRAVAALAYSGARALQWPHHGASERENVKEIISKLHETVKFTIKHQLSINCAPEPSSQLKRWPFCNFTHRILPGRVCWQQLLHRSWQRSERERSPPQWSLTVLLAQRVPIEPTSCR